MADDNATRASLLWRLGSDQNQVREIAWEQFHAHYAPTIHRFASRMGATSDEADDVVQDVMLGFYGAVPNFVYAPEKGRFRGYLKTCVCRVLKRRRERSRPVAGGDELLDAAAAQTGLVWDELWEQRLFERAVGEFNQGQSPKQQDIFRCCVLNGKSPTEAAESLGMTIDAAYKARQRALAEFRSILKDIADDEP